MIRVDTDQICAAIKDVFEDTRTILEPAGALAIAGAKIHVERTGVRGKKLVAVASGANTNFDRLRFIAERAEVGDRRETILAVTIPERPGSFKKFCATLGARNITEFNYRIADPKEAHVFVGVEVHSRDESAKIVKVLERQDLRPSTCRRTRWPSCTCDIWSGAMPRRGSGRAHAARPTSCSTGSSFRSARER